MKLCVQEAVPASRVWPPLRAPWPWALPLACLHVLPSEGAQSPLQGETVSLGELSRALGPFCLTLQSLGR